MLLRNQQCWLTLLTLLLHRWLYWNIYNYHCTVVCGNSHHNLNKSLFFNILILVKYATVLPVCLSGPLTSRAFWTSHCWCDSRFYNFQSVIYHWNIGHCTMIWLKFRDLQNMEVFSLFICTVRELHEGGGSLVSVMCTLWFVIHRGWNVLFHNYRFLVYYAV